MNYLANFWRENWMASQFYDSPINVPPQHYFLFIRNNKCNK
jgi:hypothetical protein